MFSSTPTICSKLSILDAVFLVGTTINFFPKIIENATAWNDDAIIISASLIYVINSSGDAPYLQIPLAPYFKL